MDVMLASDNMSTPTSPSQYPARFSAPVHLLSYSSLALMH